MKIFGCGDILVAKRLPTKRYEGFTEIRDAIRSHDACFGNLETTVHYNEGYPSKFPGGGYSMASPYCLNDLKEYGFNVFNLANNHMLDYSHKGLEATLQYLYKADITFCGAGVNLAEASRPKYIECPDGRVAFIGITSSFHDSDAAGPAGGIVPGRPGVNPLRRKEYYQLTPDLYKSLGQIAEATGMNDGHKWSIANGYRDATKGLFLREMKFVEGSESKRITHPLLEDLERVKTSIREATFQSECVVVSFHSHQMERSAEYPATFIIEFCHECIDAGANIIFGHGAHELRGLEIYKGMPIFYGLGDFIFHNEMEEVMPREFYEMLELDEKLYDNVGIAMNVRSKNETRGLQADSKAWEAIGASLEFIDGVFKKIIVYPISLGFSLGHNRRGWPMLDKSGKVIKYFASLSSKQFGTLISLEHGTGVISIENNR